MNDLGVPHSLLPLRGKFRVGLSGVALFCFDQKAHLAPKELRAFLDQNNRSFNNPSIPHAKELIKTFVHTF